MAQTPLQICNSAILKLGGRTIAAYGNTSTKEGQLVTEAFPRVLSQMLRGHVWGFAKVVTEVAGTADASVSPWTRRHALPTNPTIARILSIVVEEEPIEFERVGDNIHTRNESIVIRYVRNFDPTTSGLTFPDDFAEALSCYLAAEISLSLTQNSDLRADFFEKYLMLLRDARFNGAVERQPLAIEADSTWLNARLSWFEEQRRDNRPLDVP